MTANMRRWLLPEHIEDVLPPEARVIERLRRAILDLFESHGYELVAPRLWRETFRKALELTDGQLRFFGLVSMVAGLAILLVVRR